MKDLPRKIPNFKLPAVQHHASLLRISMEKVKGHWQGAVYPFREGFQSGIVRLAFGNDGALFVGMTNAGWGGRGGGPNRFVQAQELHVPVA